MRCEFCSNVNTIRHVFNCLVGNLDDSREVSFEKFGEIHEICIKCSNEALNGIESHEMIKNAESNPMRYEIWH